MDDHPTGSHQSTTHYDDLRIALSHWRKRTIGLLWLTYASFYLCRVNLAAAQKVLAADRGMAKEQLGFILAAMKVCYAGGQFLNGVLADRFGPRLFVMFGLAGSAVINLVFAHLDSYRAMALAWALNGYCQACGWTPVVRTIANWFPPRLRDAASGIIGPSYILGGGLSWLLAGALTERYGWRYAFWTPAWVCLGVMVVFSLLIKVRPEDAGFGGIEAEPQLAEPASAAPSYASALCNPRLWALGLANLALIFGYHGLLDWTPHFLAETDHSNAAMAARQAFLMPLGGTAGCLGITVLARRRATRLGRAAVIVPLLMLAVLTYAFPAIVTQAPGSVPACLFVLGVLSAAPASLIAVAMSANIGTARAAGAAAGLVDAMGYVGSATSGWASGRIMDRVTRTQGAAAGWRAVWHTWPLGMLVAAVLVAVAAPPRRCQPEREAR